MRNILVVLFILFLIVGCHKKDDRIEKVHMYYEAFNTSDYNQVMELITDSITIIEGDYIMGYTHPTFHEHFKWDSVFRPTNKVIDIQESGSDIIATVEVHSPRFKFLKNNPLTCKHKISFEGNKLTKFENLDCIDADWSIWEKERDSLVSWIKINHPELDGFIYDLTMNGAINYLKAIALYEESIKE
ncbi:hypothetical protein [Aquimarina litoralis]|uniref:hypothetical protein n=1 Tax=Aquimarina litoralis TaxID=584605 RepID=UPI001C59E54A|nr:hypothetical protein [Aquimarina litoralis]MBW1295022.1 hypothetical protein [Aquimarina litoralis]